MCSHVLCTCSHAVIQMTRSPHSEWLFPSLFSIATAIDRRARRSCSLSSITSWSAFF